MEAFKNYYDEKQLATDMRNMVQHFLNPNGTRTCWGFKEVRYNSDMNKDLEFLRSLCTEPRIILHMWKNETKQLEAPFEKSVMEKQIACFRTLAGVPEPNDHTKTNCSLDTPKFPTHPQVFLHYLEDYIDHNINHVKLWEYIGYPPPIQEDMIELSSRNRNQNGN